MNDYSVAGKFTAWAAAAFLALGLTTAGAKALTFKMAAMAADAQEHQMSYGRFSRSLWAPKHARH